MSQPCRDCGRQTDRPNNGMCMHCYQKHERASKKHKKGASVKAPKETTREPERASPACVECVVMKRMSRYQHVRHIVCGPCTAW